MMSLWSKRILPLLFLLLSAIAITPAAHSAEATIAQLYANTPFRLLNVSEQAWQGGPAVAVTFSVPLSERLELGRFLQITDAQGQPVKGDWILGPSGTVAYFPFVEPEQTYNTRIANSLPSALGSTLKAPAEASITIQPLRPSLRFVSRGSQLSPDLTEGIEIEAVNVAEADLDLWRVRSDKLVSFLSEELGTSNYELRQLKDKAELVYSGRYKLSIPKNKRQKRLIDVMDLDPLEKAGVFVAVMKPAGDYPYDYATTWFSVSDLGLHVRQAPRQLNAWVHSLTDADPERGVTVQLLGGDGKLTAQQRTNELGLAQFDSGYENAELALVVDNDQMALVRLKRPALDLTEYSLPARPQHDVELFLYGPRDLYRPGESLKVQGLLRRHDGKALANMPIRAELLRPDGRVYQTRVWRGDRFGYYEYNVDLSEGESTGLWRFRATLADGTEFEYPLQVEAFLPERMRLFIQPDRTAYRLQDSAKLSLQGEYLWGAPAANNRLEAELKVRPARKLSEKYADFMFGIDSTFSEQISLPALLLDPRGQGELSVPNHWKQQDMPLEMSATLSLFESGGRPVVRRWNASFWPREQQVGVRPLWQGDVAPPEGAAQIELINIDRDDQLQGIGYLDATLIREDQQYYWRWDDQGWDYNRSERDLPVLNRVLSWKAGERATLDLPLEYGNYRLELRGKQGELLNSYRFFAGWRWDGEQGGKGPRPEQVTLRWDRESYRPGDKAQLTLEAPFSGQAVVMVEADKLLWQQRVRVQEGKAQVTIPVDSAWTRHDIYATALVLRAGSRSAERMPRRALGMRHLPLDRRSQTFEVVLNAPEKNLPEQPLRVEVAVSRADGSAVPADVQLTLAAVDTGVLSISRFKTPDPAGWLFGARSFTSELRDSYSHLIEQSKAEQARQRFGGDAALSRGGEAPASDVQIVSLFEGPVSLDAQGRGVVTLPIPYFNGELRLMAVAFDEQAVGSGDQAVKIAAPVVAEINLPRFLAMEDKADAVWDLQNMLEEPRELSVIVTASQELGGAELRRTLVLSGGGRASLSLGMEALAAIGSGQLTLNVESVDSLEPAVRIERSWSLGVRPPFPAQASEQRAVLKGRQAMPLTDPLLAKLLPATTEVRLQLSSSPALDMERHFSALMQYPYGCLEQTSSRLWPLMMASDTDLQRFSVNGSELQVGERLATVQRALGRIAGMQRFDGSFGLWSNQSSEAHWLSAYATELLLIAQRQGYAVDEAVLKDALARLTEYLKTRGRLYSEGQVYSESPAHYQLSYRAYAGRVLAMAGRVPLADLRYLFDQLASKAQSPLPLANLASALELAGDFPRANKAWQMALRWGALKPVYGGDYGSPLRDLAWTILLASESQMSPSPWSLLTELQDQLRDQTWLSTQERMVLYRLSLVLERRTGDSWNAELSQDGVPRSLTRNSSWSNRWAGYQLPEQMALQNRGNNPLFVSYRVQGYPLEKPEPISNGIEVKRDFFDLSGKPKNLNHISSGDFLLVRLQMMATEKRLPEALVVELLPAGFELENQNLDTAVSMQDLKVENRTLADWLSSGNIQHQAYLDDRYVAAVELPKKRPVTLFYLARAVTAGAFMVPPTQVEDMYRPEYRAVGDTPGRIQIGGR